MTTQSRSRVVLSFVLLLVLPCTVTLATGINENRERSEAIRKEMWASGDAGFATTEVPEKWKQEEAVILMRDLSYSYRKEFLSPYLQFHRRIHVRVKVNSARAIEEYSKLTIQGSIGNSSVIRRPYAGVKIMKANGTVNEVPMSLAVKETESLNNRDYESYKLAVPNLEAGDIMDYYVVYEQQINISLEKYFAFDPVVLPLNSEFPTVKIRISFNVLRRCYINLKSLNGAPKLKQVNPEEDEDHYFLEVDDLRGVPSSAYIYPYRQLPSIKFKVVFTSVPGAVTGFLGEAGKVKSTVGVKEIRDLMSRVFIPAAGSELKSYMKKNYKEVKDFNVLARQAYYAYRNIYAVKETEMNLIAGREETSPSMLWAVVNLSAYYKSKKIPHEVYIGIPRHISSIDDLLIENELSFMMKVSASANKPFYIGRMNANSILNEVDDDLQGTVVLAGNGLESASAWRLMKEDVPADKPEANQEVIQMTAKLIDLKEGMTELSYTVSSLGYKKHILQSDFLDYYDYEAEERKQFKMSGIEGMKPSNKTTFLKMRQEYLASKPSKLGEKLKNNYLNEYDLPVESTDTIKLIQTGRFDEKPEFIFAFKTVVKDLTRSAGPNYLLNVGKLIEKQSPAPSATYLREFDAYLRPAHQTTYSITIPIPDGYVARGVDVLNTSLDNAVGSFSLMATMNDGSLILNYSKTYKKSFVPKAEWDLLEAFLKGASTVNSKQILLEKK